MPTARPLITISQQLLTAYGCPDLDYYDEWSYFSSCQMVCPPRYFHQQLTASRKYLDNILTRRGPFTDEEWVPGDETITSLEQSKVL